MNAAREELPVTPMLGRLWCPVCEPGADPAREILDVRWCDLHEPRRAGSADAQAVGPIPIPVEAGGEDNRRWCDLIHRGRTCGGS